MRRSMRKKILTKVFAIFVVLLMVLPLAGCFDNGADLKESFIKSMEIQSSRSISTLSVTNNVPDEQLSPEALAIFSLLEKGLVMGADMESLTSMKLSLTFENGDALRALLGWNYPQVASLDFYVDGGKIAIKTSADPLYLVIDPAEAGLLAPDENVDFSAAFGAGYTQEQTEKAYSFIKALTRDFDFPLSRVEPVETVKLELPDGVVEARKIKISLDFEEILALVTYFAEHLAESEAFKDYMTASLREPLKRMEDSGTLPPEELPSEEEIEELTEMSYRQMQSSLSQAVDYLHTVSPAVLKKQFGLDLSAEVEYNLDEEGFIRKTKSAYRIKAEHEALEPLLGTSQLDLTIRSKQLLWNINKPVEVDFPAVDEQVSFFALVGDPSLQEKMEGGPLSLFLNLLPVPGRDEAPTANLMIDLDKNLYLVNGKPTELAPAPYFEGKTLMVPFRALAELAGGEISWTPETAEACYQDGQTEVKFTSGKQAFVNGTEMDLAEAVVLKDGRFMLPADLAEKMAQHFVFQEEENIAIFIF